MDLKRRGRSVTQFIYLVSGNKQFISREYALFF
nr:MAG TPA: hypothetical protein [Caudoviricetes sp.]